MKPDDELCLCFHVSWRKVLNYLRVEGVKQASQLSGCYGAGTGCGWCRKQLIRIGERAIADPPSAQEIDSWLEANSPAKQAYEEGRKKYIEGGKKGPPSE